MSLFGGFQDAWTKKFPGQNLPQAWEDDVRANLITHRRRVAVLKEELEKESFYVEYLERLLAEVEKHRKNTTTTSDAVLEAAAVDAAAAGEVGQVTAQNGRSHQMLLSSLGLCSQEKLENGEDDATSSTQSAHDKVNGELNRGKGNEVSTKPSPADAHKDAAEVTEEEDSKSQSSSSHSSPAVNKKKIPPKPPPKRSRPTLAYKGSLKVDQVSKDTSSHSPDLSLRSRIKSLPPAVSLEEKSHAQNRQMSKQNLTKTDSIKSSSSVDEYEELRHVVEEEDDYVNLEKTEYDDNTLKSEASVQSGHSSRSGGLSGGEVSPAAGLEEDEDEFTSGAEENSPKYSDYVNIDYFLKKRARLRSVEEGGGGRVDSSEVGTAVGDYSDEEEDDDDGMGLLLHTLVSAGNACSTEDEEEGNVRMEQEAALALASVAAPDPAGPPVVVGGTRVVTEEHDVLDGDSADQTDESKTSEEEKRGREGGRAERVKLDTI